MVLSRLFPCPVRVRQTMIGDKLIGSPGCLCSAGRMPIGALPVGEDRDQVIAQSRAGSDRIMV
jgi:hypothetical protein